MKSILRYLSIVVLAGVSTIAAGVGTGASFKGPLGLQLYSLRADFTKNVELGLAEAKKFGFKEVELAGTYNMPPEKFKEMLDKAGFVPIAGHFPYSRFKTDPEGIAKDAKALGLKYAGCAAIDKKGDFDMEEADEAVKTFNHAGKVLNKQGLKFFFHCHGAEFTPHGNETFMDYIIKNTDPNLVAFEMDVFWVVHPGHDPVKYLERYPGRWQLMHVKDMKKGTQTGLLTGSSDVKNDVAIGTGMMNWPAILKAAEKSGVKYYFIEDESPTVKEQIPQSLKYLQQVKF